MISFCLLPTWICATLSISAKQYQHYVCDCQQKLEILKRRYQFDVWYKHTHTILEYFPYTKNKSKNICECTSRRGDVRMRWKTQSVKHLALVRASGDWCRCAAAAVQRVVQSFQRINVKKSPLPLLYCWCCDVWDATSHWLACSGWLYSYQVNIVLYRYGTSTINWRFSSMFFIRKSYKTLQCYQPPIHLLSSFCFNIFWNA